MAYFANKSFSFFMFLFLYINCFGHQIYWTKGILAIAPNDKLKTIAQLHKIKSLKNSSSIIYFDEQGNVTKRIYGLNSTSRHVFTFTYDDLNRVCSSIYQHSACFESEYSTRSYEYDLEGNSHSILTLDIRTRYVTNELTKERVDIGKYPDRKKYYTNGQLTKVEVYKKGKMFKTLYQKNVDTKERSQAQWFNNLLKNKAQTFTCKDTITDYSDNKWILTCSEDGLISQEQYIDDNYEISGYSVFIKYEFYENK